MISVVIPCYNHGHFLQQAIDSVLRQRYPSLEIIVVNDGSSDETEAVALGNGVVYLAQENKGLAAARNAGIDAASGNYLVFLDADDYFLDNALQLQMAEMDKHPDAAFISGGHILHDENLSVREQVSSPFESDFYEHLLQGNYIGMHAAVLYRRFVFDNFRFDTQLRASEDYDLYFKVVDKYPVYNHQQPIAVYRKHGSNMSYNLPLMLRSTLQVLERQKPFLHTAQRQRLYRGGRFKWIYYYGQKMCDHLLLFPSLPANIRRQFIACFFRYRPAFFFKYLYFKLLKPTVPARSPKQ